VVFFKILLVGYLNNNNRDRKQLEFCNDSSAIRSFLNLEIDEALPSHSNFYSKKQSSKTSKLKRLLMRSFFHTTMNFFLENGVVQRLRVLAAGVPSL
jgi:transposase